MCAVVCVCMCVCGSVSVCESLRGVCVYTEVYIILYILNIYVDLVIQCTMYTIYCTLYIE